MNMLKQKYPKLLKDLRKVVIYDINALNDIANKYNLSLALVDWYWRTIPERN